MRAIEGACHGCTGDTTMRPRYVLIPLLAMAVAAMPASAGFTGSNFRMAGAGGRRERRAGRVEAAARRHADLARRFGRAAMHARPDTREGWLGRPLSGRCRD